MVDWLDDVDCVVGVAEVLCVPVEVGGALGRVGPATLMGAVAVDDVTVVPDVGSVTGATRTGTPPPAFVAMVGESAGIVVEVAPGTGSTDDGEVSEPVWPG